MLLYLSIYKLSTNVGVFNITLLNISVVAKM